MVAFPYRSDTAAQPDWSDDTATGKGIRIRILWEFIHGKILGDFGPVLQLDTASAERPMSWSNELAWAVYQNAMEGNLVLDCHTWGQRWVTVKDYLDGFLDSNF